MTFGGLPKSFYDAFKSDSAPQLTLLLDKFTFSHCSYPTKQYLIPETAVSFSLDGVALPGVGDTPLSNFKQRIDSKYLNPESFPFELVPDTPRGYAFSSFFGFKVLADITKVQVRKPKEGVQTSNQTAQ